MNVKFHKNCETGEILKISYATFHLVKFDIHTRRASFSEHLSQNVNVMY